ncbi:hypothetical protein Q7P36_001074 [Cladosporium allicinum]
MSSPVVDINTPAPRRDVKVDPKPASASVLASDFIVCARSRKVAVTSTTRRQLDFCGGGECLSPSIPRDSNRLHSASRDLSVIKPRLRSGQHRMCLSEARSLARSLLLHILLHHRALVALRFPINIDIDLSSPSP